MKQQYENIYFLMKYEYIQHEKYSWQICGDSKANTLILGYNWALPNSVVSFMNGTAKHNLLYETIFISLRSSDSLGGGLGSEHFEKI